MASKVKPTCKYGKKCYRRNPQHIKEYSHQDRSDDEESVQVESMKKDEEKPAAGKKRHKTMDDYFGSAVAKKAKVSPEKKDIKEPETGSSAGNSSGYKRDSVIDDEVSADDEDCPTSPTDLKENIKAKFLVEMPEDFYEFWDFAFSINPKNPRDAFKKSLGFQLVGPFDVLAGRSCTKNSSGKKPNYLIHWRYFYDPPEFMTVIRGDDKSQFHLGYFRDDPAEMPCFVASNSAGENCTLTPRGPNLFAALSWATDSKLKKDKNNSLKELKSSLNDWAKKKNISLESKTKEMKARDKKVVTKTFHGAGLVVPVDPVTEVGYREVPETPADLKRMLKKIVDSKSDEERDKNFDPLMEIITLVQFANDECDYGEGIELGLDLFSYGEKVFHKTILNLLPLGYEFLNRQEFGKIIEAHLKDRQRTHELDQLA